MTNPSYDVIMTCRDGSNTIKKSIDSWLNQSIPPDKIVVVNDGSKDNSREIIESYNKDNVHLIEQPNTPYDVKRICHNWNIGLLHCDTNNTYHVIATEDSSVSKDYSEVLLSNADRYTLALSGTYDNRKFTQPTGIARFVNNGLFRRLFNNRYPYRCGYESAILYEGMRLGYNNKVIYDAVSYHHRPLGTNHNFKEFVIASLLLGFSKQYIQFRLLKMFKQHDINITQLINLTLLLYTFTPHGAYNGNYYSMYANVLRTFVRNIEHENIKHYAHGISVQYIYSMINRL